jgi:hypothetical protein
VVLPLAFALPPQLAANPLPQLVAPGASAMAADPLAVFQQLVAQIVAQTVAHSGDTDAGTPPASEQLPAIPTAVANAPTPPPKASRTDRAQSLVKDQGADDEKKRSMAIAIPVMPPLPILLTPDPLPVPAQAAPAAKVEAPPADTPEAKVLQPLPILELRIHAQAPGAPVARAGESVPPAAQTVEAAAEQQPGPQTSADGQPNPDTGRDSRPTPRFEIKPASDSTPHVTRDFDAAGPLPHSKAETVADQPMLTVSPTPAPVLRDAKPEPPVNSAPPLPDFPPEAKAPSPMRTLALEFTPDGARDIKVRLAERAGDVHISLHGTDPALAGRVREGVNDLVGALSKAGYEADAWSPGQGGQQSRRQYESGKSARGRSRASGEEFTGILQQPIEEIS